MVINIQKDKILLIEDDAEMSSLIVKFLSKKGLDVESVKTGDDGFEMLNNFKPKVIIADLYLQNSTISGMSMIQMLKKKSPFSSIIVISGHNNMKPIMHNLNLGIYDFLEKPFNYYKLYSSVLRACESYHINHENKLLKDNKVLIKQYVGESSNALKVHKYIHKTAKKNIRTFIFGDRGLGKESIARTIHHLSENKDGHFIKYVKSIEENSMFEEFFIDIHNRDSIIHQAQHGTLFIDNIEYLNIKTQNELVSVFNNGYYKNHEKNTFEEININLIICGLQDPRELMKLRKMTQEIYGLIAYNVFQAPNITLMKEDFPLFIKKITQEVIAECGVDKRIFSSEAIAFLQLYKWKGGFRELKSVVERVLIYNQQTGPVDANELMQFMTVNDEEMLKKHYLTKEAEELKSQDNNFVLQINLSDFSQSSLKDLRIYCEVQFIRMQMERFNYNISKTAAAIDMERSALHRKLKSLGISINECVS